MPPTSTMPGKIIILNGTSSSGKTTLSHALQVCLQEPYQHIALDQLSSGHPVSPGSITQPPMYFIALCASDAAHLPDTDGKLWLFDDREESVYSHYHGEIKRNMAAGGIIAGLEKEIEELKKQSEKAVSLKPAWWRRLLGKS